MSFSVRPLTLQDIPAVVEIYTDAVRHGTASYELEPPGQDEMIARFVAITSKGYPYLAAVNDAGALLGYAYASAFRTRPAYRWLVEDSIYLAKHARGLGIGKILLQALVVQCEALGFRQMVAVIGGASEASIAVHRSCGFSHAGRLTGTGFKNDVWLDTVLMQRPLGPAQSSKPDLSSYPGTMI